MRREKISIETQLRDGTPVLIRQVRPGDKELLRVGLHQLSDESKHFPFLSGKKDLSDAELKTFTEVDHHDHDAWGAFDMSQTPARPIGIARYVRHEPGGQTAEFAVTVVDDYQGRGLGSLLLGIAAARARENGIWRFHSIELADNHPLFAMLRGLETTTQYIGEGEADVTVRLYDDAGAYAQGPAGDAMRAAYRLYHEASARSQAA